MKDIADAVRKGPMLTWLASSESSRTDRRAVVVLFCKQSTSAAASYAKEYAIAAPGLPHGRDLSATVASSACGWRPSATCAWRPRPHRVRQGPHARLPSGTITGMLTDVWPAGRHPDFHDLRRACV